MNAPASQLLIPGSGPVPTAELVALARKLGDGPEREAVMAELRSRWVTPAWLAAAVAERIGRDGWDLDLCAEAETAKAPTWWGPGSPWGSCGLAAELPGDFVTTSGLPPRLAPAAWCNPPWDRAAEWLDRVVALHRVIPWATFCVPSRTEQPWWHELEAAERAGWASRIPVLGRVSYELHPLVEAAGLIATGRPRDATTVWVLHPFDARPDLTPIDARRGGGKKGHAVRCNRKLGETFELPLSKIEVPDAPEARNYRDEDPDGSGLRDLALSMAELGQLHPVLVYWTGRGYAVAAGFRRVAALQAYAARYNFKKVAVKLVAEEVADLVRLAENFDRANPTTFETCRYVAELLDGDRGKKRTAPEVAGAIGVSVSHARNLARFYRAAPPEVRERWQADRDGRFSFRVLDALARRLKGKDADAAAELERTLAENDRPSRRVKAAPPARPVAEAEDTEPAPSVFDIPPEPPPARLGRGTARQLLGFLDAAALDAGDERIDIARELLAAVAGENEKGAPHAKAVVAGLLLDLGAELPTGLRGVGKRILDETWTPWDEPEPAAPTPRPFPTPPEIAELVPGLAEAERAAAEAFERNAKRRAQKEASDAP
jgi:ParB-like chromosome segregation protein Spo0J